MKKLLLLLFSVLLFSCNSWEDRKSELKSEYGIDTLKTKSDYENFPNSYGEFQLESVNQYLISGQHTTASYFLLVGSLESTSESSNIYRMVVKFPNGSRVLEVPVQYIVLNYDSINPRCKIDYNTLLWIKQLKNRDTKSDPFSTPIYLWVPRNSIFTNKVDTTSIKYESINK